MERFGVSVATARALCALGEKAWDLPHLVESLCVGDLSLDKVRAVAALATAQSERRLGEVAKECSVRQLGDLARRRRRPPARASPRAPSPSASLRFNEQCHSVSVQLPAGPSPRPGPASRPAPVPCPLTARRPGTSASATPSSSWSPPPPTSPARRSAGHQTAVPSPYVVVAHVPLAALVDPAGEESALAGELERDGLISTETVRRLACDATLVVGVDDDVGHTMYEGRARRTPNPAQRREVLRRDRHCRFPGCTNVTFTNTHHVVAWKPGGPDRSRQPRPALRAPPSPGPFHGLADDRQRQRGAQFRRPERPRHDHAPLPAVDERHGPFAVELGEAQPQVGLGPE